MMGGERADADDLFRIHFMRIENTRGGSLLLFHFISADGSDSKAAPRYRFHSLRSEATRGGAQLSKRWS